MRNVNECNADFVVKIVKVNQQAGAKLCIKCRKRFVKQKDFRFVYKCTCNGDALLLSAGKLVRLFVDVLVKLNKMNVMTHFFVYFIFSEFPQF